MKIVICESDGFYRFLYQEIIAHIAAENGIKANIISLSNGTELIELAQKEPDTIDLLYLAMRLDDADGIEIARKLRDLRENCGIVFVTGNNTGLSEAFDVRAVNYIVKGNIGIERFKEIFLQAIHRMDALKGEQLRLIKERQAVQIPLSEIMYFEVFNRVVITYYTEDKVRKKIETYGSLKKIDSQLSTDFIRVHNSYIVNMKYVKSVFAHEIEMEDGARIPLSRSHKKDFLARWGADYMR
ncbi:MAG: LytTR family DNA-binding domain-containing protein [Eubacteriaceae bacterium]|nr:LytTR family DNA-binding domain-containing protein [Eubacteriaceae bacterium]